MPKEFPRYGDRVEKERIRALIQTGKQAFVGFIYIHPGFRVKDNLNRKEDEFIAVTEANIVGQDVKFPFILLRAEEIIWIAPLEDEAVVTPADLGL